MNKSPFTISIIIPAKDEETRLPRFLDELHQFCRVSTHQYEIIVVDDGSTDHTTAVAQSFHPKFTQLRVITLPENHGKGYAVKQGLLTSTGAIALFMDADGSTPAIEIERNLHFFDEGYDIVIGSRVLKHPSRSVKARFYRRCMGTVFNFIVATFLIKNIKDTQCGFKMFRQEIIKPLWSSVLLEGFGFDLEVLYLAQRQNYRIKESAVSWTHVDGSKIDPIKDSLRMLQNIFQIRQLHG